MVSCFSLFRFRAHQLKVIFEQIFRFFISCIRKLWNCYYPVIHLVKRCLNLNLIGIMFFLFFKFVLLQMVFELHTRRRASQTELLTPFQSHDPCARSTALQKWPPFIVRTRNLLPWLIWFYIGILQRASVPWQDLEVFAFTAAGPWFCIRSSSL